MIKFSKYINIEEQIRNDKADPETDFDFNVINDYLKNNNFKQINNFINKSYFGDLYNFIDKYVFFYDNNNNSIPKKYSFKEKFLKFAHENDFIKFENQVKNFRI